ncbi:MAG: diacylglycerol kinase family protein [Actinobacteria bacterium]|nr:diacylglycerol kinase family protein [Actinomycetota bacterium]
MSDRDHRPRRRRLAAAAAFGLLLWAVLVAVALLLGNLDRLLIVVFAISVGAAALFVAVTRRDWVRLAGWVVVGVVLFVLVRLVIDRPEDLGSILLVSVFAFGGVTSARYAMHLDMATLQESPNPGVAVGRSRQGVLIMNLKSGGGKVEEFDLVNETRRRGVEPVVLKPGDDLLQVAMDAVEAGADVIGMAGGDGSQALVATVASQHDVAYVCVPAGTRNHFALDLGLDRTDLVGALDAFTDGVERRVDLAKVGDRVFVNNVSLGIYARIVQSDEYRDAKAQTALTMLPDLFGPDAEPFDLRFVGPDGHAYPSAHMMLVSNNPYQLTQILGRATRARMDSGLLGVVTVRIDDASYIAELVALEAAGQIGRFRGWLEWTPSGFTVDSLSPIEAGIDGEALVLEPPLEFVSMPGALRVRLPRHAPGLSPAAIAAASRLRSDNVRRLWAIARGEDLRTRTYWHSCTSRL